MAKTVWVKELDDGMRLVFQPTKAKAASFVFMVGCGSRYEDPNVVGVSHALEHMMFKGTKKRTAQEIVTEMSGLGAQLNAYTSVEKTAYWLKAPISVLSEAIAIYADSLLHSLLAEQEWAKERGAVFEELKMSENNLQRATYRLLDESTFGLPYGVIGSQETIGRINTESMRGMIGRHYHPENIVISIVGNLTHSEAFAMAQGRFGKFGKAWGIRRTEQDLALVPTVHAKRQCTERIGKFDQTGIGISFPGFSHTDERSYALDVLSKILGGGMASRLFQEVREKRGLVYSVGSCVSTLRDAGSMQVFAFSTKPLEAMEVIARELAKIKQHGVSKQELMRAKRSLRGAIEMAEGVFKRADTNADSILFRGRVVGDEEEIEHIEKVSLFDILSVAQTALDFTASSIALTGTESIRSQVLGIWPTA